MSRRFVGGTAGQRLRDQELRPVTTTPSTEAAFARLGASDWQVIVDADGAPVGTVSAGRRVTSAVVVAHADLTVSAALDSAAFEEVDPDVGVVVVDDERIIGIWAGESLARELLQRSVSRGVFGGSSLPGYPQIPLIKHTCAHVEKTINCNTMDSFQRRPVVMPPCPNLNHLSPHTFVW